MEEERVNTEGSMLDSKKSKHVSIKLLIWYVHIAKSFVLPKYFDLIHKIRAVGHQTSSPYSGILLSVSFITVG